MNTPADDHHWMRLALDQALQAQAAGEVPVGAVVVRHGQLLAQAGNAPIAQHDPTAHAEIRALRLAGAASGNYRLSDCELFVTLEPCAMCAAAMLHARLKRVVFAAPDPKAGAAGSVLNLFANRAINHHTQVIAGPLAQESAQLLRSFFDQRRRQAKRDRCPLREDALRTPSHCFDALPPLAAQSHWICDLPALQGLQFHYLDHHPQAASQTWVLLHGRTTWSACWASVLNSAIPGVRMLAPDLIGFGRSDKPKKAHWHSAQRHVAILCEWLVRLGVRGARLIEPVHDALSGAKAGQTLGQLLQTLTPEIITARATHALPVLPEALVAMPYPDAGHRAAWRAFPPILPINP
ncbi:MAG: hypothetical protein OHK0048_14830 [Rhodoferax sp.]